MGLSVIEANSNKIKPLVDVFSSVSIDGGFPILLNTQNYHLSINLCDYLNGIYTLIRILLVRYFLMLDWVPKVMGSTLSYSHQLDSIPYGFRPPIPRFL